MAELEPVGHSSREAYATAGCVPGVIQMFPATNVTEDPGPSIVHCSAGRSCCADLEQESRCSSFLKLYSVAEGAQELRLTESLVPSKCLPDESTE